MSVRVHAIKKSASGGLWARLDSMRSLPIRPVTAREVIASVPDEPGDADAGIPEAGRSKVQAPFELDPGWVLLQTRFGEAFDPIRAVAEQDWWQPSGTPAGFAEVIQKFWRHSVAVAIAARSLAREAGMSCPERFFQAGLLHGLGRWVAAALNPAWFTQWHNEADANARIAAERQEFGTELAELGRKFALRWRCPSLVVDAIWLHDSSSRMMRRAAGDTEAIAVIHDAFGLAEKTPWALAAATNWTTAPAEPRLRILIAEVQSRCGSLFTAADATSHEEKSTRKAARLTGLLGEAKQTISTQQRVLMTIADTQPYESSISWASRAAKAWCEEPEVTAARVVWQTGQPSHGHVEGDGNEPKREASIVIPIASRSTRSPEVHLWCRREVGLPNRLSESTAVAAWGRWASIIAEREDAEQRLQNVIEVVRQETEIEESVGSAARLAALAEFAAGAGHELNNPLAVIVGRAQLLLGRSTDPDISKSLRIILSQAQRSHRILRDLMFVARPQPLRPRACRPQEILRTTAADFKEECEARGIRLTVETEPEDQPTWADPDALSHCVETLLRNALQSTGPGGRIHVGADRREDQFRWRVTDSGKGISPSEGTHLFDPFYCGRQAGRGLGLGLSRLHRMISLAGGSLQWSSTVGQGSVFQIQLPVVNPPQEIPTGT